MILCKTTRRALRNPPSRKSKCLPKASIGTGRMAHSEVIKRMAGYA